MAELEVIVEGRRTSTISYEPGTSLLDTLASLGIAPEIGCDRSGRCGRCRVLVWGQLTAPTSQELARLSKDELKDGWRLACQASLIDGHIRVVLTTPGNISVVVASKDQTISAESIICKTRRLGVAVDLGTTTLAVQMIDLESGRIIAARGMLNPQTIIGPDLISRITYADKPGGLRELQRLIFSGVMELIRGIIKEFSLSVDAVERLVLVGNSVMDHLFLGLSPHDLGVFPYRPVRTGAVKLTADQLSIGLPPHTEIYLPPLVAGFVGSDAVAGAMVLGFGHEKKKPRLLLDLGTNGEVLLEKDGHCWCCSTAAGPAFEGDGVVDGIRAVPGALVSWSYSKGQFYLKTIDDSPVRGIAGSGLLSVIAQMRRLNIIRPDGRLASVDNWPEGLMDMHNEKNGIWLSQERTVGLYPHDIRSFQLAKGAIRAAVEGVLKVSKTQPLEIDQLLLAGAMASYINPDDLLEIGLLPRIKSEKIVAVGNAAISGGTRLLTSESERDWVEEWVKQISYIELAGEKWFEDCFLMGMALTKS